MSHLKPFSPAMACERQPLSKLPLDARAMIEAYCGPPAPTPTARIIKEAVSYKADRASHILLFPTLWRSRFYDWPLGCNVGFMKYLINNFDQSPGSVWTHRFTHRKVGHALFCNVRWNSWRYDAGIDRNRNSIKYPGLAESS